ncbi:Hypothetical predicted protein [Marmota monax]|uniref:Uncharacterized protein n=1 Tax=Marmota monax TaxID=9995 RepID=A0A5E4AD62_MARMO|nr:Hypothetical predicted protein [Marmota monax]
MEQPGHCGAPWWDSPCRDQVTNFRAVVSSDSDSDSDLSSSSLEDRLPPTGVRNTKGDKLVGESGGSTESPRMGLTHPPSLLSGSQSSLTSETGEGSADPQGGGPPWPEPKGPGKRHPRASPRC